DDNTIEFESATKVEITTNGDNARESKTMIEEGETKVDNDVIGRREKIETIVKTKLIEKRKKEINNSRIDEEEEWFNRMS
ncbi:unnamed protein product, partial [Sphenostylis stenocarpa]